MLHRREVGGVKVTLPDTVDLRWHPDGEWELLAPIVVAADGMEIIVHEGFRTYLASIPRAFRSITPQVGKHIPIAIVHDFLYRHPVLSRAEADAIFLAGMEHLGVYWLRRQAMYRAVRAFGWASYNKG